MSDELNPDVIKRTQNVLGKYVKKPGLTEKLLKKPPFRFLYDVFSVIIRDTKCFVGLYTLEELTYENVKDRDDKMKFLQKMIDVVKITTGSSLAIKTSKIVAGHEPDKTNELLQLIGEIIEKKLDWQTAVEQVVSGSKERKELPRQPKEKTSKMSTATTKDKHKDKLKEKESKPRDSKTTKVSASKSLTTNKDDKIKKIKTKDNVTKQVVTKDRTLKASKELEKFVKNSVNESSKPKIKRGDSLSSNKSSPTPNSQGPKMEPKSIQNETEHTHEAIEQQPEKPKIATTPIKLSNSELSNRHEVSVDNHNDSPKLKRLSPEKSKNGSAESRKLSAEKSVEISGKQAEDQEITTNLEESHKKSELSNTLLKENSLSTTPKREQVQKQMASEPLNAQQREHPATPEKSSPKPSQSSPPPPTSSNDMKRESTFTRDNSIESNKSVLSNRPRTSLRPPSARPPSARPGAPRRRDKNIEIILQPNDQIKMSGIQVKLETFGDLDDDGENLVIIENPNGNDSTLDPQANLTESEKMLQDETLEQGHLVQQILETQKELVQQQTDASSQQKTDKDSTNNLVMRQTSARHMDNLRDVIQNITKSVNPLGKLMDFIPEDIDAMQLEFSLWRDTYTQAANELKREKSLTESATEPMKTQLIQIEANIVEYTEIINASRVKILQNSEKILKMLTA